MALPPAADVPTVRRIGAAPTRNAVVAISGRSDLTVPQRQNQVRDLQVNAVVTALTKLPVSATRGSITVTITKAARGPRPNEVQFVTFASRDGQPLPGWDRDHIIRNPRLDFYDPIEDTVCEDPAARVLSDLLDIAIRL